MEHTPKNVPWLTALPVTAKKSLFMVVIFAVFLFRVKPAGVFGVILRFFSNFKPLKNMCLPVFFVVSCETPGIFSVLCNFFDCRLVFICFCCVFGLIWLIINGFCCYFLVSRETCRFHSRFLLFCGNFCSLCCFFCFGWFVWGYFLVLNGFYYVFAFNGCTYLKF